MKHLDSQNNKDNSIRKVYSNDICTGCGICESVCTKKAISIVVKKSKFRPSVDNTKCSNCGLCYKVCPGVGVNIEEMSKVVFYETANYNRFLGFYEKCYAGYSTDSLIRQSSASGGLISQFLVWLLEAKYIDGALLTTFDKNYPFYVRTYIARTKEEILASKGSKYCPVTLHEGLKELKKAEKGNYVIVALPCQVHGLRKLMAVNKNIRDKIYGIFSLFCSGTQSFKYTEYIVTQCGGNLKNLEYLAYREGNPTGMVAKGVTFEFFKDYGTYNKPLKSTFYPKRCLFCIDMFGELSDISFGDIQVEDNKLVGDGLSGLIVRNSMWHSLLKDAQKDNAISLVQITEDQMLYKRSMASVKKYRNASFVRLFTLLHLPSPKYDDMFDVRINAKVIFKYIYMRTKQFVGNHKCLWFLLPKIK